MTAIEEELVQNELKPLSSDDQMLFMMTYECFVLWALKQGMQQLLKFSDGSTFRRCGNCGQTPSEGAQYMNTTPNDWSRDSLGKYLEDARYNMVATFGNRRPQYDAAAAIDQLYCTMLDNLAQSPDYFAGFFLFRTHSSFRVGVGLCLGGQVPEAYMVFRSCIESALYGLYMAGDETRQEMWLRRHDDDAARRRVKNEFTIANVQSHLQGIDAKTHGIVKSLYEQTIDLGGHPNERVITTQIAIESTEECHSFSADYFLCGGLPHALALKTASRVGICCLDIFSHVFRVRYQLLGIDLRLDQLRQGL